MIALFTNPVLKSLQRCQSKMTHVAVVNALSFLFANMFDSTQICAGWAV